MAHLATPLVFPLGGGLYSGTSVDVWAQDLLEVTFVEPMKNDDFLQAHEAYSVVAIDGGDPIEVVGVATGNLIAPISIFLIVTPPSIGKRYKVFFQNLYAVTGAVLSPLGCEFIARPTKQDAVIQSRPEMLDMRNGALARTVYQAVARQDDLIGGSRSDRLLAVQTLFQAPIVVDFTPKTGAGGVTVRIRGTNFTNASAVKFNGFNAQSFVVVDDSTVDAIVPVAAGTGPISITTPIGTAASTASFVGL